MEFQSLFYAFWSSSVISFLNHQGSSCLLMSNFNFQLNLEALLFSRYLEKRPVYLFEALVSLLESSGSTISGLRTQVMICILEDSAYSIFSQRDVLFVLRVRNFLRCLSQLLCLFQVIINKFDESYSAKESMIYKQGQKQDKNNVYPDALENLKKKELIMECFCIIIKLMSKDFKMERQLPYLGEEDYKKLFPQEYYRKYAAHLNILNFEQTILKIHQPQKKISTFSERKKVHSLIDLHKNHKVRMNKYDPISDTIAKNKVQAVRAEKFMRSLGHKLNQGPPKKNNVIRTPLVGFAELPDQVLNKMQLIDNQRYEQQLQKIRQKRRAEDEYVKFMGRNNSMSASKLSLKRNRSILADSAQSHSIQDFKQNQMSNTMQLQAIKLKFQLSTARQEPASQSLTYQQRLKMLMDEARSEIIGLNPEDKMMEVKYITAMNKSIRKINNLQDQLKSERRKQNLHSSNKKNKPLGLMSKQDRYGARKNLIDMTARIRQEGSDIEVLSYYKDLIRGRQLKEFLKQKQSKEHVLNQS